MRKLIIASVALVLVACSESSQSTAPEPFFNVKSESSEPPTCRSGYAIANRNGEWVCEPTTSTVPEPVSGNSEAPTCRSGYAIANRDGQWVCEPIE